MTLPLRVNVAPERADAAPGDNLQFDVTVRNASDIVEHYGVEMLGLPEGATVRTEPEVAKLRPAESGTLTVRVGLPVQPPAPAGTYVVGALVRSKYRYDVSRCVEVPLQLASVEQLTVRTSPEVVTGGRSGQYTVEVANGGNAPVRLYLTATDPERRVTATFQPPWVDLPPGTAARTLLTVAAPKPWNREKARQLTVAANPDLPGAAPVTSTATFVQQPRLASKFAKIAGIAAGVVVLAAAIAVPMLLSRNNQNETPVAQNVPAAAPTGAQQQQPQPSAAAPPAVASAAPPSQAAPPPATTEAQQATEAPTTNPPDNGGQARTVDLTRPPDGVVASDFFRNEGFLVSADPGAVSIPGCENARSAAVVTVNNQRFLTSSLADDPTRCNNVPLLIDFLADAPAGAAQVTPLQQNTLTMEIVYRDLFRSQSTNLTVPTDQAQARGGIDFLVIRPAAAGDPPVAVTKLRFAPLN